MDKREISGKNTMTIFGICSILFTAAEIMSYF